MYNSAGEVGLTEVVVMVVVVTPPPGVSGTVAGGGERPKLNLNRLRIPSEIKLNE